MTGKSAWAQGQSFLITNLDKFFLRFKFVDYDIFTVTNSGDTDVQATVRSQMGIVGQCFDQAIVDDFVYVETGMKWSQCSGTCFDGNLQYFACALACDDKRQ